jgi:hypothetical protein
LIFLEKNEEEEKNMRELVPGALLDQLEFDWE